jgi:hypothetical protein
MSNHEFEEWSQCPSFRKNGGNKLISKKDLIRREAEHNLEKWKNDPVHQEIYTLAQNPNRTAADDKRLNELRNLKNNDLSFTSTSPINEYPTQEEIRADKIRRFAYGVIKPR